ncbi:carbohydrate kinase family protein [Amycolatopsis sp.]|uniref:carbohydrate kinase family protein n=1 Tax=Amycolatopsis sp. TaxID=37632 RepID=UPI002D15E4C6|nr:carbohydrate kinase family protein [Amycolatopsis sp.]HVV10791.1 carbohydrate kinase family protein [Amycolatopsis sp.]
MSSTTLPGEISIRLAGTGWTTARTLQTLGSEVTFATYVGADPIGRLAVDGLRRHGLYGPATLVCAEQPRAMVLYDRAGSRSGASDLRTTPLLRYPADRVAVDSSVVAAVLTNIGFTRPLIPLCVDRGIPFATDLHLFDSLSYNRDWMSEAHILARSHETLDGSPESWIRETWRQFGTEVVIVGCGGEGSVIGRRSNGEVWHVRPSTPRGVRFVGGAGDTMLAAFVHYYFTLGDAVAAGRHAVLAAGWKVGGGPEEEAGVSAELSAHHALPAVIRLS